MPKKKAAKSDSSVSKTPAGVEPKKHCNVTMDGEEDKDIADISPEEAKRIWNSMPQAVRDEIMKEADAQNAEMIQQFEEHAKVITTPESVKAEDEALRKFYADTKFVQVGGKLDAMALTQKEVEREAAESNQDGEYEKEHPETAPSAKTRKAQRANAESDLI